MAEGYGIELVPIKGYSVKIPAYGTNNAYYSSDLTLILTKVDGDIFDDAVRKLDISECQEITWVQS